MNKKVLCKYLGGSHLYKLNTPQSDEDIRSVFMNTDSSYILGLNRFDEERNQIQNEVDEVGKELNHFINLLQKGNTEALESIWCDESSFTELTPEFKKLRANKFDLIDSEKFFKSLRGYAQGELKLAKGERAGQIGGKRFAAVKQYGFSPKNFTNLFRLMYCGIEFYKNGNYVVDCSKFGKYEYEFLYKVKTKPEEFKVDFLEHLYYALDVELKNVYNKTVFEYTFNKDLANRLLLQFYYPHLKKEIKDEMFF